MTLTLALEITGTVFGLLGTLLLHRPGRWAPYGFVCWLVSNPATMAFMWTQGHYWLLLQSTIADLSVRTRSA